MYSTIKVGEPEPYAGVFLPSFLKSGVSDPPDGAARLDLHFESDASFRAESYALDITYILRSIRHPNLLVPKRKIYI